VTTHRIAAISFRLGHLDCSCGALVRNDRDVRQKVARSSFTLASAGTPEALAGAFAEHRREAGASDRNATIAYSNSGFAFNRATR